MAEVQYLVKRLPRRLAARGSVGTITDSPAYGGPAERESDAASVSAVRGTVGVVTDKPLVHQDGELANGVVTLQVFVVLTIMQSACDETRNGLVFTSN